MFFFFCLCRIRDNEGAAEMLIDTLGPGIVNGKDSKNRQAKQTSTVGITASLAQILTFFRLFVSPGLRSTPRPSQTTSSVSSCC